MSVVPWNTNQTQIPLQSLSLMPPEEERQVSLGEVAGAAFRLDNPIASYFSYIGPSRAEKTEVEDGFDIFAQLEADGLSGHARSAMDIFNSRAYAKWKMQVERENLDRQTRDAGGWTGLGLSVLASIADPTIAMPGGSIYRGVKGGYSLLKSAASVGTMSAAAVAAQETGLQATQETRTAAETGLSIGGGFVLGALLGGGAAAILGKAELASTARTIDAAMVGKWADEQPALEAEAQQIITQAAGAQVTPKLSIEDLSVSGAAAQGLMSLGKALYVSPTTRWVNSRSPAFRRTMSQTIRNPLYMNIHRREDGPVPGPSVEEMVGMFERGRTFAGGAIEAYRAGREAVTKKGMKIPKKEFDLMVDREFRGYAKSGIPEVEKIAAEMRKFDDLMGTEVRAAGLNYKEQRDSPFHGLRMWLKPSMDRDKPKVMEKIKKNLREQLDARVAREHQRKQKVDAIVARKIDALSLGPEDTARLLKELPEEIKALREANARFLPFEEEERAVRRGVRKGTIDSAQAKESYADIRARAGQDYADYVSKRAELNSRLQLIRENIVSKTDEVERVRAKVADLEIANLTRLSKLHEQLGVLDRRALEEGPDAIAEDLSALRTQFVKTLEKSNEAQVRISELEAKLEAEKTRDAGKADAIEQEIVRKVSDEEKRIAALTRLADEISELEAVDPEDVIRNLDQLVTRRLEDTANLIERETERMMRLAARAEKADPEKVRARIKQLEARKTQSDLYHNDLLYRQLDADNNYDGYLSEAAETTFNTLTGRMEVPTSGRFTPKERGPLKNRVPHLKDQDFEDWIEHDPEILMRRTARLMAGQAYLAKMNGGDITLANKFHEITEDYQRLMAEVRSNPKLTEAQKEKQITTLQAEERRDKKDLEIQRDRILGTHMAHENVTAAARILGGIAQFNVITKLGGVAIANLAEVAKPIMVHGLGNFMRYGVAPLVTNLKTVKLASKDAQMGGTAMQRVVHSRAESLAGMYDINTNRTPVENLLRNMSSTFISMTGLNLLTDMLQDVTGVITQQRIINGVLNFDKISKREKDYLRYLNIGDAERQKLAKYFKGFSFDDNGLMIANTSAWTGDDAEIARRIFYTSINKDVDSIITMPGMGDLPNAAHNPYLAPLFQIRSFTFASYANILGRGMQEGAGRFATGLMTMTAMGIGVQYFRMAAQGNLDEWDEKNWAWTVTKGFENSGIAALAFEANAIMERGLGVGAYSFVGGDESVYAAKSFVSAVGGPTFDTIDKIARVGAQTVPRFDEQGRFTGPNLTESGANAIRSLFPLAGLPYFSAPLEYGIMPVWHGYVEGD